MRTAARVIRHQSDRQPPHTLSIQTSCDESRSHRRVVQARVVNRVAPAAQHQLLQTVDPSSIPVLRRLKIPCLSRRTCPSWRHQSMASQSRPMSSGPFTSMRRRHRERCCHHLCPTCPSVPVLTAVNFHADRGSGCNRKSLGALRLRNVRTVVAEPQLLWLDRRTRDKLSRRQNRSSCNGGRSSL
jgi:hypothetical protein